MSASILAFVTDGVGDLAASWSGAGLASPYIAVDLRQFPQDDPDADYEWQGVLLDGTGAGPGVEGPLLSLLSDLRPDRVTIASIRGTEAGDGRPGAMEHLAKHLLIRAADDAKRVAIEPFDLVYPQEADGSGPLRTSRQVTQFGVPGLPAHYRRLIISPEDSTAPGEPDAGVRPETRHAVALHAALAVLGVLGGDWPNLLVELGADRMRPVIVRGHSRLVAGGRLCRNLAADYVAGPLMLASRSNCDPQGYRTVSGEEGQSLLVAAADRFTAEWTGGLSYEPPAMPPWRPAPRLSLSKHLQIFLNFVPFALAVMLRGGGSATDGRSEPAGSFMESEDLGYSLDEVAEEPPAAWRRWRAMDEAHAERIRTSLAKADTASSEKVNPSAWKQLAQLATALCDGSDLPFEVPGVELDDRRLLLRADDVAEDIAEPRTKPVLGASGASATTDSASQSSELPDPSPEEVVRRVAEAELRRAEPIRSSTFVAALAWARRDPVPAPAHGTAASGDTVVKTQRELAEQEVAESEAFAAARRSQLHAPGAPCAATFLSTLRARTLGDLLAAATDAARWQRAALRESQIDPSRMERHLARFSRAARSMLVLAAVLGILWWVQGAQIMEWVEQRTDIDWSAGQVALVASLLWVVVGLWVTAVLYRRYAAEAERARRLMEARTRAWSAAEHVFAERNRLRVVDRVTALWDEVLSRSLVGVGDAAVLRSSLTDPQGISRPVAMQVAPPVMGSAEKRRVDRDLTEQATTPGWRMRWLVALVRATELEDLSTDDSGADSPLAEHWFTDDGLGDTPLRELHEAVSAPEPWARVAREWVDSLDDRLAVTYFADHDCPIEAPYVLLGAEETTCGPWFKPLRESAAPRHIIRAEASTEGQPGSGAEVLIAEFPGRERRSSGPDAQFRVLAMQARAPGTTAVSGRLELLPMDPHSLYLVPDVSRKETTTTGSDDLDDQTRAD